MRHRRSSHPARKRNANAPAAAVGTGFCRAFVETLVAAAGGGFRGGLVGLPNELVLLAAHRGLGVVIFCSACAFTLAFARQRGDGVPQLLSRGFDLVADLIDDTRGRGLRLYVFSGMPGGFVREKLSPALAVV